WTITKTGSTFNIFGSHTYTQSASNLPFRVDLMDFAGPAVTPATAFQVPSGAGHVGPVGNPAYQEGTHTLTQGIYVAHVSKLAGVYNPATSGALLPLSYSFDFHVFSSTGGTNDQVAAGLLVKQKESYYIADYHAVSQNGLWNNSTN